MFLTEDEARKRWCPLGRQYEITQLPASHTATGYWMAGSSAVSPAFNRKAAGDVPACIASSCMAWRFASPQKIREIDMVTGEIEEAQPRKGYCGAFGRPEYE